MRSAGRPVVAALDWWVPPAGIVEPAIAASIVFVGVENLVRQQIGIPRSDEIATNLTSEPSSSRILFLTLLAM